MTNIATPQHIGFIIDGNRRWAREKHLPDFAGHLEGRKRFREIVRACKDKGIKIITIYTFSTENWGRPEKEVKFLMSLIERALSEDMAKIHKEGFKIKVIGQREKLPESLKKTVKKAELLTKRNQWGIINFALSYGGRIEIVEAVKKIVKSKIPPGKITQDLVSDNLWTAGLPDPDLIIRTGGEQRLSNFLTWQSAYSELYFTSTYWPDFKEKGLDEALEWFLSRKRRFGK
ncbi:MAG: di-trans,poly-cis-decaprenylcistransferase [Candidatus Nealsonbacteria bacterium]|nr:di-trans,poly-cis-decaprenylcistransferase [Candidatus Nealsonbacteria bacterium]